MLQSTKTKKQKKTWIHTSFTVLHRCYMNPVPQSPMNPLHLEMYVVNACITLHYPAYCLYCKNEKWCVFRCMVKWRKLQPDLYLWIITVHVVTMTLDVYYVSTRSEEKRWGEMNGVSWSFNNDFINITLGAILI